MVSQKPWSLEAAARLFITVIVTLFFGMFLASLVEARKAWTSDQRDFAEMILMTVFFQGAALFWITLFLRQSEISWRQSFFSSGRTWRAAALGLLVGAVSTEALVWLQAALTELSEKLFHKHLEAQELVEKLSNPALSLSAKIFFGLTAIAVAPLAEETLFRGVLYPTIKQLGYPRAACWGTSVLFGLSHASLTAFVPLTIFALVLVWLYEVSDNLMAPIMAHCAFNAVNYYWILSMASSGGAAH